MTNYFRPKGPCVFFMYIHVNAFLFLCFSEAKKMNMILCLDNFKILFWPIKLEKCHK